MTDATDDAGPIDSLSDPSALRNRPAVANQTERREVPEDQHAALAERYEQLDGVVQFGICRDGAVLLERHEHSDQWHPPGSNVPTGEDWVAATERAAETLTGEPVDVEQPVVYGRTTFQPAAGDGEPVVAETVVFGVTFTNDAEAFERDPMAVEHPLYGDVEEIGLELAWFESVPEDVDPNHEDEVDRLLQ